MAFSSAYHDSDADDEYERSIMTSPILATDDETSPTDSDPPSTEPTPTTFAHSMDHFTQLSPGNTILAWTAKQCADYIGNLGLPQYGDKILDNDVVGEALIALQHEELKEMGIVSVGHRLTILRGVYDIKIKQGIPLDSDHWTPPSVEGHVPEQTATRDDISRVIKSMELRDHRILTLESNLNKLTEEYRRLREELVRLAKPLPHPGHTVHPGTQSPDPHFIDPDERSPYSQVLDSGKSLSPSHNPIQQSAPSPREPRENSAPTSPVNYANQVASQRNHPPTPSMNSTVNLSSYPSDRDRGPSAPSSANAARPQRSVYPPNDDPPSAGAREPSVEIFKSFRVSMEDPCEKVLPAALKKYNINADWKNYALYIVYGDQERCLGLKEKPLILFKQLDKEGRKPMFMLRRHAAPMEGHSGPSGGGGGGGASGGFSGGGSGYEQLRSHQSSIQLPQLPGGVL